MGVTAPSNFWLHASATDPIKIQCSTNLIDWISWKSAGPRDILGNPYTATFQIVADKPSMFFRFRVFAKPVIIKQPIDQYYDPSTNSEFKATFEAVATGTEPITYTWFVNNRPESQGSKWVLNPFYDEPTERTFQVLVENADGKVLSNLVRLKRVSLPFAPEYLTGRQYRLHITEGQRPWRTWGEYEWHAGSGYYTLIGIDNVPNSDGTYEYSRTSTSTGTITFVDSLAGAGWSQQLEWTSPTGGLFRIQGIKGGTYQLGQFYEMPVWP